MLTNKSILITGPNISVTPVDLNPAYPYPVTLVILPLRSNIAGVFIFIPAKELNLKSK